MTGDASYARMLWKMAYEDHLNGDCDCPDCAYAAAIVEREEREAWETDRACEPVEVAS